MDELGHLGWVAHHSFELDGLLFGIRTDSRAFAQWLRDALPATLVRDEEAEPNYSVLIRRPNRELGKRFHLLYKDSTVLAHTFDANELVRALLADLEALTYWRRGDAVYVRAMSLSTDGIDALLPEELISTFDEIRRRIHALGVQLPVSRYVAVDLDAAEAMPPPRSLEIDAAALEELTRVVPSEPTAWPRTAIERRTTIDLLCTMGSPDGEPVQPVSRGWALYVLASNATNLTQVGGAGLEALRRLIERASCWQIAPRRPHPMAQSVLDVARTVAAQRADATAGGLQSA